jgi:hypothetical protein
MKSKSSIFILVVVILLVVGALIYFFVGGSNTAAAQSSSLVSTNTGKTTGLVVATTGASNTGDQVVSLLRNLSTIQLSDAVFQNPGFGLLQDISIALPPVVNPGRRNPFAPIGNDAAATVTPVTTSVTTTPITGSATAPTTSATSTH